MSTPEDANQRDSQADVRCRQNDDDDVDIQSAILQSVVEDRQVVSQKVCEMYFC